MGGLFVTLDGPGGAGKSTLAALIAGRLTAAGRPTLATREPSLSLIGVLAREHTDIIGGAALACLVAADRYQHLATEIRPALASGSTVICDRYVPSSYVLQQLDGVPLDFIRRLNDLADRPHLALLVTAAPSILERRLAKRGAHSRFEHQGSSSREAHLYDDLAAGALAADGFRLHRVDTGDISPQVATDAVMDLICSLSSRQ
ncbi:dTMP kinase [Nonomuraea glycinis]|uniref:dTMP kinase n=1 Tax=Nonomuraea glycinis TaxID=2047744 RepID=UPI0033A568C4